MTLKTEEGEICQWPRCASGQVVGQVAKIADERHVEVQASFARLEIGQQKMIEIMITVATLLADVTNMKNDIKHSESVHTELFTRIRELDTTVITKSEVVGIVATIGVVVTIIEVVFKWVLPK